MRRLGFVAALAGCYSPTVPGACEIACTDNSACPGDLTCNGGLCSDGVSCAGNTPIDDTNSGPCAGSVAAPLGQICLDPPPPEPAFTANKLIDTDNPGCRQDIGGVSVCLVPTSGIALDAVVSATGPRPLVLWSSNVIQIDGTLDGSSVTTRLGPGANPVDCASGQIDGEVVASAPIVGSGGAGGSFGTSMMANLAGRGGNVTGGSPNMQDGGTPKPVLSAIAFHGGCPGGTGGGAGGVDTSPGSGGGAIYVVAANGITVGNNARISAGGNGGGGSKGKTSGGHGGGSGGWIVIDASGNPIIILGQVAALGGGGGAGGNGSISGDDGAPSFTARGFGAPPTQGCTNGGGSGTVDGGDSTGVGCGGGGGGGADGLVQTF